MTYRYNPPLAGEALEEYNENTRKLKEFAVLQRKKLEEAIASRERYQRLQQAKAARVIEEPRSKRQQLLWRVITSDGLEYYQTSKHWAQARRKAYKKGIRMNDYPWTPDWVKLVWSLKLDRIVVMFESPINARSYDGEKAS